MSIVGYERPAQIPLNQPNPLVAYHKAETLTPIHLQVKEILPSPPAVADPRPGPTVQITPPDSMQNGLNRQHSMSTSSYGTMRTPPNALTSHDSLRSSSSSMRRTSSTRSGGAPSGYVASMRKQKATVWCDRSQPEDPRVLAQQRAAKSIATMEIIGSSPHGSSLSGGSASKSSKIRHGQKQGSIGYSPAEMVRGVDSMKPILSANEAADNSDEEDGVSHLSGGMKGRTGSGRSSISSSKRYTMSGGSMTANASSSSSLHKLRMGGSESSPRIGSFDESKTHTGLSLESRGSSNGEEQSFGGLGSLTGVPTARVPTSDELRRRGSVDDRALGLSKVRLFVANPDNDDD
jgi:hypothetical protein